MFYETQKRPFLLSPLFRVHFSVSSCRVETPVIKCVANLATGDTVCQVVRRRRGTHRPQIGKQILSVAEKRPPVLQMDFGSSRPLFAVLFCDIKERTLGALLLI